MSTPSNGVAIASPNTKMPPSGSTTSIVPDEHRDPTVNGQRKPSLPSSSTKPDLSLDPSHIFRNATSPSDVRSSLDALHAREASVTARLNSLLAAQHDLSRTLARLDNLRAGLGAQVIATRGISNHMLAGASETAAHLSSRVRGLDLEKQRVEDTLRVVEQVAELKACVAGVVGSMGAPQDWEAAAGYIARAAKIPDEIVRGGFAAAVVPTVEVPDPPAVTLESARESLCGLFLREFDKATTESDGARVTRFFKLFPLIGRGDVGLDVYGRYVCQGVAGTARAVLKDGTNTVGGQGRKDGFFYANALTKLFEHIAQIVENHGALVERHYGPGKMVRVIERLQMEADVQGGIILDSWSDERGVSRKLTEVKSYPFSFLVQSFLPPQRGFGGTPRVNSPALGAGSNAEARNSEDEGVDMKEVDGLLSEIAVMLGRWSLYSRFLAGKCREPDTPADAPLTIPDALTQSNLNRKVLAKLMVPYKEMTTFFFRRSVEKAFQLDEFPSGLSLNMKQAIDGNSPYIISAVDVVMYIVNAVVQKSISTAQRGVIDNIIPSVSSLLGTDFIGMIQRKMRDESFPEAVVSGGLPPEDKIVSFIVLINSLDMANEYLNRIITGLLGPSEATNGTGQGLPPALKDAFPFRNDARDVVTRLRNLNLSFSSKANDVLNDAIQVLFSKVIQRRLGPVMKDTFREVDYTLTEEELAELAAQNDEDEDSLLEQVPRRFEHGWEALMRPIARLMTPRSFKGVMGLTARYLARVLEKKLWSYAGRTTPYGTIRMERDFNGVIAAASRGNYALREVFSRTTQVLMVANMDEDEWDELLAVGEDGDDGMAWVLSEEERRRARTLVRE